MAPWVAAPCDAVLLYCVAAHLQYLRWQRTWMRPSRGSFGGPSRGMPARSCSRAWPRSSSMLRSAWRAKPSGPKGRSSRSSSRTRPQREWRRMTGADSTWSSMVPLLWREALCCDATLVFPVSQDGQPLAQGRSANENGPAMATFTRRTKATYPELLCNGPQRLVALGHGSRGPRSHPHSAGPLCAMPRLPLGLGVSGLN